MPVHVQTDPVVLDLGIQTEFITPEVPFFPSPAPHGAPQRCPPCVCSRLAAALRLRNDNRSSCMRSRLPDAPTPTPTTAPTAPWSPPAPPRTTTPRRSSCTPCRCNRRSSCKRGRKWPSTTRARRSPVPVPLPGQGLGLGQGEGGERWTGASGTAQSSRPRRGSGGGRNLCNLCTRSRCVFLVKPPQDASTSPPHSCVYSPLGVSTRRPRKRCPCPPPSPSPRSPWAARPPAPSATASNATATVPAGFGATAGPRLRNAWRGRWLPSTRTGTCLRYVFVMRVLVHSRRTVVVLVVGLLGGGGGV